MTDRILEQRIEAILKTIDGTREAADLNLYIGQLKEEATIDGLTSLWTRKHFDAMLNEGIARAARKDTPYGLLMIDIDDFKRYNDTYGHPFGDRVISDVGEAIMRSLKRPYDHAARYGGDEFAYAGEGTPGELLRIGTNMLGEIRTIEIPSTDGIVTVTASIGLGILQEGGDARRLIEEADRSLYLVKRSGKNDIGSIGQNDNPNS